MTRQQKYPDTNTFHFHNANPKGRITTDCVIRAICVATELPYNQVVMELADFSVRLATMTVRRSSMVCILKAKASRR